MTPALPDGAVARIVLGDAGSCTVGDVIAFRQDRDVVVHRVLLRVDRSRVLLTRGDSRVAPDPPVAFENVLGVVSGIVSGSDVMPVPARRAIKFYPLDVLVSTIVIAALRISPALAGGIARALTYVERGALLLIARRKREGTNI